MIPVNLPGWMYHSLPMEFPCNVGRFDFASWYVSICRFMVLSLVTRLNKIYVLNLSDSVLCCRTANSADGLPGFLSLLRQT